jgi:DNA-directed RNA polymerase specialized sigma24 family protein
VPADDVDDVAQTVLCDALAAREVPSDPEELRRWVSGIARHKIADYHRRRGRRGSATLAGESERERDFISEPVAPAATSPAVVEERQVLAGLLGEIRPGRDAETMEWLVREHGGERLADIAAENNLPAPVVRQRVSRLRRALRTRWASLLGAGAVLGLLLAVGGGAADFAVEAGAPEIVHEPASTGRAAASLEAVPWGGSIEGDWVVQSVIPSRPLSPAEERVLALEARSATVRIGARTVDLGLTTHTKHWQITGMNPETSSARATVELREPADPAGSTEVDVALEHDALGSRLELTFRGARFPGKVTLRRPVL